MYVSVCQHSKPGYRKPRSRYFLSCFLWAESSITHSLSGSIALWLALELRLGYTCDYNIQWESWWLSMFVCNRPCYVVNCQRNDSVPITLNTINSSILRISIYRYLYISLQKSPPKSSSESTRIYQVLHNLNRFLTLDHLLVHSRSIQHALLKQNIAISSNSIFFSQWIYVEIYFKKWITSILAILAILSHANCYFWINNVLLIVVCTRFTTWTRISLDIRVSGYVRTWILRW